MEQAAGEFEKGRICGQLGSAHYNKGYFQEAITFYEKYFEIYKKIVPLTHPVFAVWHNNVGSVYDSLGDYPKALSSLKKALS